MKAAAKQAGIAKVRKERHRKARDSDRVRAIGMARLFFEGKSTGEELARALQVLGVRGTFDTEWPGPTTLAAEVMAFDELGAAWALEPSAAAAKTAKYGFICRRYDVLRARGFARPRAIEQIADEGYMNWRQYDGPREAARLAHIDWSRVDEALGDAHARIPEPTNELESRKYLTKLARGERARIPRVRDHRDPRADRG